MNPRRRSTRTRRTRTARRPASSTAATPVEACEGPRAQARLARLVAPRRPAEALRRNAGSPALPGSPDGFAAKGVEDELVSARKVGDDYGGGETVETTSWASDDGEKKTAPGRKVGDDYGGGGGDDDDDGEDPYALPRTSTSRG